MIWLIAYLVVAVCVMLLVAWFDGALDDDDAGIGLPPFWIGVLWLAVLPMAVIGLGLEEVTAAGRRHRARKKAAGGER
jgi:hypothetical protein